VLHDIMFGNRRHFRELVAGSEEGIATNILASRLKQLVAAGLLSREATRRGRRAAYSLTEAGPDAAGHGRARQLGLGAPRRRFSTLRSTLRPMLLPDCLHQQPHPCDVLVWLPSDDVALLPVPGLLGPAPRDGLRCDVLAS
jgi:hypothetical protein